MIPTPSKHDIQGGQSGLLLPASIVCPDGGRGDSPIGRKVADTSVY